jgi:hypothetical protein
MACRLCGFETTVLSTDAKPPMCKNGSCQICIAVTEVDEEINQAVATLRRLMAKRCDLRSEQNRVHGLIHRLPVELKNRIFELLLPSRDKWGEIRRTERTAMSYLNSILVCRGWRDIALANPFLWSTIHITLGTSNTSSLFNDRILRSGTLPVTFHLQVTDNEKGLERSREVLDALSQCSNRLQSLSFVFQAHTTLGALQDSNFQYHSLMRLRIMSLGPYERSDQPLSLLNPTASPEKTGVSLRSLQISWNRLTSAQIDSFDFEDLIQLFQHAPQMTCCKIFSLRRGSSNFSMPPIIHYKLKTLHLYWRAPPVFGSLTLPCLQELLFFDVILLIQLPALVRRSSCPLTKLTLFYPPSGELLPFDDLRPLPGVTDLVVGHWDERPQDIKRLLLEGYFPDLRRLTLRLQPSR